MANARLKQLFVFCIVIQALAFIFCNMSRSEQNDLKDLSRTEHEVLYNAGKAMEDKNYSKAKNTIKEFIATQKGQTDYRLYFHLANTYALLNDQEKALKTYKKAIAKYDKDLALIQNTAKVCYELEKFVQAGEYLKQAYRLKKDKDPDLLYQAASCLIMAQKSKKAYAFLQELCSKKKEEVCSNWLQALAQVSMELGRKEKALQTIKRLLNREPGNPRWWKMLTNAYIRYKNYDQAAASLKMHNQISASSKEDLLLLGDLYALAKIPLQAARQYEKALKQSKEPSLYKKTASSYLAAHQPEQAIRILRQALENSPKAKLWHKLGNIHYNNKSYAKAYHAFKQSLKLNPDNGQAVLMLGYSALKAKSRQEAVSAFKKALKYKAHRQTAKQILKSIQTVKATSASG